MTDSLQMGQYLFCYCEWEKQFVCDGCFFKSLAANLIDSLEIRNKSNSVYSKKGLGQNFQYVSVYACYLHNTDLVCYADYEVLSLYLCTF